MSECVLVIISTPAVEESLVDWLLTCEGVSGFSTVSSSGHSTAHQHLSLAEQVTGRKRQVMFHVHTDVEVAQRVVEGLRQDFRGAGLHYWMVPALEAGHIR